MLTSISASRFVAVALFSLQFACKTVAQGEALPYTVTASSFQSGNEAANVLDANPNSFWHSQWNPLAEFPHTLTIDMKSATYVNGYSYLPRQDGNPNGRIGQYKITTSLDGTTWTNAAQGYFGDDSLQKRVNWAPRSARYVKLIALSEAGDRGKWSSAATVGLYTQSTLNNVDATTKGNWESTVNLPVVPVAIGLSPVTGKVVAWSAFDRSNYQNDQKAYGKTQTSTWDPNTGEVSRRTVSETNHDMFCPGISMDTNGRMIVTGGNDASRTSIYDPARESWDGAQSMNIARGYQSSTTLSDGRVFTIGGSWSGGLDGKNGEVYDPKNNRWSLLSSALVAPMLTKDRGGIFRSDNHAWLFAWKDGSVFQAGPSAKMNWYGTSGSGSTADGGDRDKDTDSMCGTAVMYDAVAGKIVTMGGSPHYEGKANGKPNVEATKNTHVITIGKPNEKATAVKKQDMGFARAFANAVVLPDGKVFVTGGQTLPVPFDDSNAILTPELWDPATETYTQVAKFSTPRTYHSVAILLLDGTVAAGGGGLCGTCTTNHYDLQIYQPPYLFNSNGVLAARPTITSVTGSGVTSTQATIVSAGGSLAVSVSGSVTRFSLIRYGTSTHTVNTDQRRIPIDNPTSAGSNKFTVQVPSDKGVALPGYWMLFAIDSNGVPSVAQTVQIV